MGQTGNLRALAGICEFHLSYFLGLKKISDGHHTTSALSLIGSSMTFRAPWSCKCNWVYVMITEINDKFDNLISDFIVSMRGFWH